MTYEHRRKPLVHEIATLLVKQIDDGAIGAGGWLPPERILSQSTGVSRNVLREAIKQLETQGVVESRHGVGTCVVKNRYKPITDSIASAVPNLGERLKQLTAIRLIVEPEIAAVAAHNVNAELIADLSAAQDGLIATGDAITAAEFDLAFHRRLAEATGNSILVLILDSLAELGRTSRQQTLSTYGIERAHAQHADILDRIASGDSVGAAAAMRANLEVTEAEVARLPME